MASAAGKSAVWQERSAPLRSISEVADDLNVPLHVLRFWESKFPVLRPVKMAGGRRYYRREDVSLLRHISDLLYNQGYTIKGAQRALDGWPKQTDRALEVSAALAELQHVAVALRKLRSGGGGSK